MIDNDHSDQPGSLGNASDENQDLRKLFEEVSKIVSNSGRSQTSPSSKEPESSPDSVSQAVKLRLYGLYKRATVGTTFDNGIQEPSFFQLEARQKFLAWQSFDSLSENQALLEYVNLASSLEWNGIGQECKTLLEQYNQATKITSTSPDKVDNCFRFIKESQYENEANGSSSTFQDQYLSISLMKHITAFLGIKPIIPRGQLDIGYSDLTFAFVQCLKDLIFHYLPITTESQTQYLEKCELKIQKLWNDTSSESSQIQQVEKQIIVGLSVRSLLDLFLLSKNYPHDSEVIITPPINIQGMIDIIQHHNLKVVPIDINPFENSDPIIQIDIDAILRQVTDKTVAILIVHPFGIISASEQQMKELSNFARSRCIDIIEDCAECFSGIKHNESCYVGSPYVDINFFSFGTIKTATCLGGGVATIPTLRQRGTDSSSNDKVYNEHTRVAHQMRRLQKDFYSRQHLLNYLFKVIRAFIMVCISRDFHKCGILVAILNYLNVNYDTLITNSVKGFPNRNKSYRQYGRGKVYGCDHTDSHEKKLRARDLLMNIRKRPCSALLSVMLRRLHQSSAVHQTTKSRISRCLTMNKYLKQYVSTIRIPRGADKFHHLYWLYPIILPHADNESRKMMIAGYDVPRGTSQLGCITSYVWSNECKGLCPNAEQMMSNLLYLPVASIPLSDEDMLRMATSLDENNNPYSFNCTEMKKKQRYLSRVLFTLFIIWDTISARFYWLASIRLIVGLLYKLIPFTVVIMFLLHIIRSKIGDFYINTANTFAKYSTMLSNDASTSKNKEGQFILDSPKISKMRECIDDSAYQQSEKIFDQETLELPDFSAQVEQKKEHDSSDQKKWVMVTGATGFIGSMLLRDLLLNRKRLGIDGGVVLICRSKRLMSASDRVEKLLSKDMYSFLTAKEKIQVVKVFEGDLTLRNLGMCDSDREQLSNNMNITHVFHCAASVKFTETLDNAAISNITSTLQLQNFIKTCRNRQVHFVYLSTAFVHGGETGTMASPLPESLFNFGKYDPALVYESMIGTQIYASSAMRDLGFPNTYTFSKCVCEHLLLMNEEVKSTIIRPCIVGPSLIYPFEGWAGEKPSTLVAGCCLYFKFQYNLWSYRKVRAPVIPVDVLCRFVLSKSFSRELKSNATSIVNDNDCSSDESYDDFSDFSFPDSDLSSKCSSSTKQIHNAVWDSTSPSCSGFLWYDFAILITHFASVMGYGNRMASYVTLFVTLKLLLIFNLSANSFRMLHDLFVRGPFSLTRYICRRMHWVKLERRMDEVGKYLDLPVLFFHFTSYSFYFKSELVASRCINGERYMFSCVLAASRFVEMLDSREAKPHDLNRSSFLSVAGRNHTPLTSDIWWALTQPRGNYAIRFIGWIVIKLLRSVTSEVTVDLESFSYTHRAVDLVNYRRDEKICVLLAPTHRSFLDFILVSFVIFTLPELGIDMPRIAAADDFSKLPFLSWLAQAAGAFFLKRGRGVIDADLRRKLESLKESSNGRLPIAIEVFLEGKRSRDRRFASPRTGFLKCLSDTGGISVVVPITISYERIPEQNSLTDQSCGCSPKELSLFHLIQWLKSSLRGKQMLGKIHISASNPILIDPSCKEEALGIARAVQCLQREKLMVSRFHIQAGASLLGLDFGVVHRALSDLECNFWPEAEESIDAAIPSSKDELWTIFCHYGHFFARFLVKSHPQWSSWLLNNHDYPKLEDISVSSDVEKIILVLKQNFDSADRIVVNTISNLRMKGFTNPTKSHIIQYVTTDEQENEPAPLFLINASLSMKYEDYQHNKLAGETMVKPIFVDGDQDEGSPSSSERFGGWGFKDSKFIVNIQQNGEKAVVMKGSRYTLSGRPMSKLIPFLEEETSIKMNILKNSLPFEAPKVELPPTSLKTSDINQILDIFGNDLNRISVNSVDRARHGTGHSQEDIYMIRKGLITELRLPDAVISPKNESEVENIISLACKNSWCLVPFGGGTNVTHATRCPIKSVDPRPMISVDMKLMNKVLSVNEEDGTAHVQAGITGRELAQEMGSRGFTIGHEPDSMEFSTLGGWIATKASGMKQSKYGNIEDIVKNIRVAGVNGLIWQNNGCHGASFGRVSVGTELSSLIFGSEGALGIITSAVIKIWPLPELREYESIVFPSFDEGLCFVRAVTKMGSLRPSSVRLLDNVQFRLGQAMKTPDTSILHKLKNSHLKILSALKGFNAKNIVSATITFEGTIQEVQFQKKIIKSLASENSGLCCGAEYGKLGYEMTFAIAYLRDFAMTYGFLSESFETFVPWSRITNVIDATWRRVKLEYHTRSLPGKPLFCYRISQLYDDGVCIYFYFGMNFENVEDPSKVFSEIESALRTEIIEKGGSLSHHHGVGKLRAPFMTTVNSKNLTDILLKLKHSIDPENVFGVRNGCYYSSS